MNNPLISLRLSLETRLMLVSQAVFNSVYTLIPLKFGMPSQSSKKSPYGINHWPMFSLKVLQFKPRAAAISITNAQVHTLEEKLSDQPGTPGFAQAVKKIEQK